MAARSAAATGAAGAAGRRRRRSNEIEINPLILRATGAVAVDAVIWEADDMTDDPTEGPIRTRREGAVLEVTLDRPKANAIDLTTSRIMGEMFRAFRDDDALRVAILRAEGEKFFCPGWDLKAAAAGDAVDGDYGVGGFGGLQELPQPEQAGDLPPSTASAAAAGWSWRCPAT